VNPVESSAPPQAGDAASANKAPASSSPTRQGWGTGLVATCIALAVLAAAGLALAWSTEQELVRRQQDSLGQASEARALAKQAQDSARDAAAKVALLEARVAENSLQRSQLEDLIQSMSRSRDENMLADVDAALRVALQQSALTGSTDPLMASLRQAEERLARNSQPRLERVRRALAHDIDQVKAVGAVDTVSLTIKLDEVVRLTDELPLLVQPDRRAATAAKPAAAPASGAAAVPDAALGGAGWGEQLDARWRALLGGIWAELRALVRVSTIEHPEAILIAPEQAYFLRANLKLRLLNARLALLSRQFETAQLDLRDAQASLERYFDRSSRRVASAVDLVKQVAGQARQITLPRPDETLAAIAAIQAGR
jgi:uroporphyrin-III C-methyltransferase